MTYTSADMQIPRSQVFRFSHRLRVRWAEVDMQKIVFNAHYLMYFDTAMTDYWRALALPYEEAMHDLGGELFVKKASVEYHASARCDDVLDVALRCQRIGNSSMAFTGAIYRGQTLLVTSELLYVFADPASQRSKPVPQSLRELLLGFEAGEPMVSLKTGTWEELGYDATDVRLQVFVDEQGKALATELDDADDCALHAVAYNRLGQAVATGRLLQSQAGRSKLSRIAVRRALRGSGQGSAVVRALRAEAIARGDSELSLAAQSSVRGFYEGLGFQPRGEVFEKAGLPHVDLFVGLQEARN